MIYHCEALMDAFSKTSCSYKFNSLRSSRFVSESAGGTRRHGARTGAFSNFMPSGASCAIRKEKTATQATS